MDSSFFRWSSPGPQTAVAVTVTATAVATATLLLLARSALRPRWGKALPNPLKTTIPRLPSDEVELLPRGGRVRTERDIGDLVAAAA